MDSIEVVTVTEDTIPVSDISSDSTYLEYIGNELVLINGDSEDV